MGMRTGINGLKIRLERWPRPGGNFGVPLIRTQIRIMIGIGLKEYILRAEHQIVSGFNTELICIMQGDKTAYFRLGCKNSGRFGD
jgi:hypothetical protein